MATRAAAKKVHLFNISPAPGSLHHQKRVGRGQGSGYGGTSGRGHNGQKSRSGPGPKPGFEGGQTPITKLIPKRGFYNQNTKEYAAVNLDRLQYWVDQGRLVSTPEQPITARELLLSGCVHDVKDGIKILGDGKEFLRSRIHLVPSRASKSAIGAIERLGGTVYCKYYNPLSLRDCIDGRTDRIAAAPTRRKDIEWYTHWGNRGYISPRAIEKMPFVEERLKELSKEYTNFKSQPFATK
ncbi:ribosomal protein L15 [Thelephora terrestris]|uniref:Ribosomal protein L15 n=1 Tax=Thelephora terrestris TaxID=56493 RepID=A0A9P6LBF2_9AGAM|nr:ribosomal protein L15 [Thelephora terrestris]